jgi:hypothetical protein
MHGGKILTMTVRVVLVLFALHGSARPLQHALHHDEAHHMEGANGRQWSAQCVDCELDKITVAPLVLQQLAAERGFPVDLEHALADRLMHDAVRGTMGRAPPACLS